MDAFVSGKEFELWGVDSQGHSGILGQICNIMFCTEICNRFTEVHIFDISNVAIGNTNRRDELIQDFQVLWEKPKA